jgi:hypothetical protein
MLYLLRLEQEKSLRLEKVVERLSPTKLKKK